MSRKKWVVSHCDRDRAAAIAESCGIEPFAAFLLCARGMTDEFDVESFLYDTDLADPLTLPDMDKACERIDEALKNGEHITVFGDYDADGVTSTALVYSYLKSRGACVDYYIPDRTEGYGMNCEVIDRLNERGTRLIVTVDNGISAVDEVAHAAEIGIDVVVTDHHRTGESLPAAVAVVDPHREDCGCEFEDWAGVGVAFKLVSALSGSDGYDILEQYGDIISLGTVADIVPLTGENRIIVRSGVAFLNAAASDGTLRIGIAALLEAAGSAEKLNSSGVAFKLAPRINAAGRMGSAERALKLLLTGDIAEAKELAAEICAANAERQNVETQISETACELIEARADIKYGRVLVVDGEGWHQGVIGIVASRLVEKYGKPCIVISRNGETAKGSGRSIDGFSLYDALSYCADTLTQFGGHTLAAGMSLECSQIEAFRKKINEYAALQDAAVPVLNIDCKLNPASLDLSVVDSLEILEPYGAENPQPLFGLFGMTLTGIQPVGNGKHLRLTAVKNGTFITVMMFSTTPSEFPFKERDVVDFAVRLAKNEFRGEQQLSIQAKDIRFSGTDDDALMASLRDYEAFCGGGELTAAQKEKIQIDRDFCGKVYKFIRSENGWAHSAEILCRRIGFAAEKTAQCKIALDVLAELGVIINKDGKYTLPSESVKVVLDDSAIFRRFS